MRLFTQEAKIKNHQLIWEAGSNTTLNNSIIRSANDPFSANGGIKILTGNLGRSVIKTAAVADENLIIEAKAIVFNEQLDLITAFKNGELEKDFIAVLPFQGPKQNGMPELHQLTPTLSVLQKRGFNVALVTDGRMSGASGKVPAAIHLTPEAKDGGMIAKIRAGDLIRLDSYHGVLTVLNQAEVEAREATYISNEDTFAFGRELFANARKMVTKSEEGASFLF
jgi:phosphogluconate dehydratase